MPTGATGYCGCLVVVPGVALSLEAGGDPLVVLASTSTCGARSWLAVRPLCGETMRSTDAILGNQLLVAFVAEVLREETWKRELLSM